MKNRILIRLAKLFAGWHALCLAQLKARVESMPPQQKAELAAILEKKTSAAEHPLAARRRRNIHSNWDGYQAQYEFNHGPHKPMNPVEREGSEALRGAQQKYAHIQR